MLIAHEEIKKLSVVERAHLFLALKSDQEMKAYLHSEKGDEFFMGSNFQKRSGVYQG